jgi:pimeloyl-ACP methyl ester carboxylesterase
MNHATTLSAVLVLAFAAPFGLAQSDRPAKPPDKPAAEKEASQAFETITRALPDKVVMTADLYRAGPKEADKTKDALPVLVCLHMTGSSRGEYRGIAPHMVELGFHVLAVDLRCGGEGEKGDRRTHVRSGTMNETWKMACQVMGRNPNYIDAYPDVGEAVKWAHEIFPHSKVGLVGSSYSASLVLVFAAEQPKLVDAVVALSPGEYMQPTWTIADKIHQLSVPCYISCGNTGADSDQAKPLALAIRAKDKLITYWPQDEGYVGDHGSKALWIGDDRSRAKNWEMFEKGIAPLKKSAAKKPEEPQKH